jgi:hypothetical protein
VLVTSAALTGGYVGLLQLNFWNVVEGWVLCGFSDGGEGLSGSLLEWKLVLVGGLGGGGGKPSSGCRRWPSSGCRRWLTLLGGIVRIVFELRTRWVPNVRIK